jgi:hypothetical protein
VSWSLRHVLAKSLRPAVRKVGRTGRWAATEMLRCVAESRGRLGDALGHRRSGAPSSHFGRLRRYAGTLKRWYAGTPSPVAPVRCKPHLRSFPSRDLCDGRQESGRRRRLADRLGG